jgi:catechol 2,3-dioxygenase-like lactoylglutathione lyase family enzyme
MRSSELRLSHIALSVSDLARSKEFYLIHFGFECLDEFSLQQDGLTIALLKKDSIILELFAFTQSHPLPEYRQSLGSDLSTIGMKHIAFECKGIDTVFRQFQSAGIVMETPIKAFADGRKYFFIKDPDGILIEFIEP